MNKDLQDFDALILIFTMGRTGSNMLVNMLNSIPDVRVKYEPPLGEGKSEPKWAENFLVDNHDFFYPKYKISGGKFLKSHVDHYGITKEFLEDIHPNPKYIHLHRDNILDQFISDKLAMKNNLWAADNKDQAGYKQSSFILDPKQWLGHERYVLATQEAYKTLLPEHHIYLTYDELVNNTQSVFEETVFDYIGVDHCKIDNPTFKQNLKPPQDTIENFEEVKHLIEKYI